MVDRLTIDEFFNALHAQGIYPLIDTPDARKVVNAVVRAYGANYPIKDRWPVLDLESAYEGHVNAQSKLSEFCRNGYKGTINLHGFDDTYSMDEWFDDFRIQWRLIDTPAVRRKMLECMPQGPRWESPVLYAAHETSVKGSLRGLLRGFRK